MKIQAIPTVNGVPANGGVVQATSDWKPSGRDAIVAKIAAMRGEAPAQAPQAPVQQHQSAIPVDANNISVEELSAIQPQTEELQPESLETPEEEIVKEEPKEEDEKILRQFAQLARQERALRAKQQQQNQAFKEREAALVEREKAVDNRPISIPKDYISIADIKASPLQIMEQAGVTYEQLTEELLNPRQRDPRTESLLAKYESRIQELEQRFDKGNKAQEEAQAAQYQQALTQIRNDAKSLIKANPVEFEAIAKTGSVKDVVDLIERHYQKHNEVLSVEDAAREVEEYLTEELYATSSRIDKIKRRLQPSVAPTKGSEVKPQAPQEKPQMKTLTNQTGTARKLNARERAILAMRGELK